LFASTFQGRKDGQKRLRGRGLFFTVVLFLEVRHDTNKLQREICEVAATVVAVIVATAVVVVVTAATDV